MEEAPVAHEKPADMPVEVNASLTKAVPGADERATDAGDADSHPALADTVEEAITSQGAHIATESVVAATEQPSAAPAPDTTAENDVMKVDDAGDDAKQADTTAEVAAVEAPIVAENAEMLGAFDSHITDALEAALTGTMDVDTTTANTNVETATTGEQVPAATATTQENILEDAVIVPTETGGGEDGEAAEGAEWEADSSPYESSSSDSDSSDDDSDDEAGSDTEMLGVNETVRMLMESAMQDSDDDDEDGGNRGAGAGGLRSKNEEVETAPPKPEIQIEAGDEVVLLGPILHVVENSAVIRGNTDGAYRVLDAGSVLCKADRTIVGVVADIIGNVRSPMYVLRYSHAEDLVKDGLAAGQDLYYPTKHAHFVFTEEIRHIKGSDASNLHDEEVAAEEAEFSDDEKEAAYKKELKARRRGGGANGTTAAGPGGNSDKRGGKRAQTNNRGAHPLRNEVGGAGNNNNNGGDGGLRYDDDEDDGPYKPLTRPANFGRGPPSQAASSPASAGGGGAVAQARDNTNGGSFRGQPRHNRGGAGGTAGRGQRGGNFRGRGSGGGRGRGGWSGGNQSTGGQQNQYNNYAQDTATPPPPQQQQQQQYNNQPSYSSPQQQGGAVAPWPFAGLPFPPPPPPPPQSGGAVPSPAASMAALLNNAQIQQLLQHHQQQQQQQQQRPPQPAWPGVQQPHQQPIQPPQYQFNYQQAPPQHQQQQQQQPQQQPQQHQQNHQQQQPATPAAAFNPASFQYLFQGGAGTGGNGANGQQQQPPNWGQQ